MNADTMMTMCKPWGQWFWPGENLWNLRKRGQRQASLERNDGKLGLQEGGIQRVKTQ